MIRWRLLLLLVGVVAPLSAQDSTASDPAPVIRLMTIGPGADIYERFGHNALWVHDPVTGADLLYNYGTFDGYAPDFVWNFVQGRPWYWLGVWGLAETLDIYRQHQRSITVQELALTPSQRVLLAARLAENATEAQRAYQYDYYLDNCSTRIRDLLDEILGGALRTATVGVPADGTLRFHTQRSITNTPTLYFGIQAVMGSTTDRPLDQWDEMFLPEKVQERIRELHLPGADGAMVPLVADERVILPIDTHQVRAAPPAWTWPALLFGAVLAGLIALGRRAGAAGVLGRAVGRFWLIAVGVGGGILLYVWFGTNHVAAQANWNVLLLTPLAFVVLAQIRVVPRQATAPIVWLRRLFVLSLVVGGLLSLTGGWVQWNHQVAALVILPSLAAWWLGQPGRRAVNP